MIKKKEKEDYVIDVSNLSKTFSGLKVVDRINISVKKGTIFAMLGPNGAGKTTTIKVLEGLIKRDSGSVKVLGFDPWDEHEKLKLKIGVMPQEFHFFEKINPLDAVTFYRDLFESNSDPESLLKLVILGDSINTPFVKLSGGQKQKLGLALALVNNPELLFLDEPTTGLDPSARRAIWSIIRRLKEQGKTIVLTTHYIEEAELLADKVTIINKGKVITSGSPEEIVLSYSPAKKLMLKSGKEMLQYLKLNGIDVTDKYGVLEIILDTKTSLSNLVSVIERSGINYSSLTVRSDRLEDVFVNLIGGISKGELNDE